MSQAESSTPISSSASEGVAPPPSPPDAPRSPAEVAALPDGAMPQLSRWALWLRNFWPARARIDAQELLRMALGVALGLLVTALLSRFWLEAAPGPWMVSSLGASAVLLFGMPASPLAQPWPVLAGTAVSALVGAACQWLVPDLAVATALAPAGPDNTRVTIRSVAGFKGDDHRIEVKGEEVHATVDIYSRTSAIAGWSVVALLRNLVSPIVF